MLSVTVRFLLSSVPSLTVPIAAGITGEMLKRTVFEQEERTSVSSNIGNSRENLQCRFKTFISIVLLVYDVHSEQDETATV